MFPRPPRRGFTLVEALLSLTVMAVAGGALLLGLQSALDATQLSEERLIAQGMAEQLLDEIAGLRYSAVGAGAYQTSLGPSVFEVGGTGRSRYDDIDDFANYVSLPPTDQYGLLLGTELGNTPGPLRTAELRPDTSLYQGWQRKVEVYYVSNANQSTRLASGQTSDYRAIEVRILSGNRELARLRRVVANVPTP